MGKWLLGAVWLLWSATWAGAQPGAKWLEVSTEHFTVLTNSSEKDARHVAAQFERMRAVFHVLMPAASDDPASPIVVLALKDRKSFRTLEPPAYLGKDQLDLAGLFVRSQTTNYVLLRLDSEGEHPFSTVYHEYTHYMFRNFEELMPLWLNEGLAEFYQNTQLADKDIRLGQPSADDILYLRQSRMIPLATLLAVDHDSPYYHNEEKGSVFYSESWALTHYLEITDKTNNLHLLPDYWKYIQQHEDSVTAAQHAFGDLNKLQKALDSYVSGSQFREFRLTIPVEFAESSFAVRAVPGPEADAVRAGVLLSVDRGKEAEDLLGTVLAADPGNALAHETMGAVKFRQHDIAAAKRWYGEAVKLDSKSYLAHYYFAVMSLQEGDVGDAAIEQSLKTAIKLNPRFAPSFDALAEFYASRHEKLDEAHALNATAIQLEPTNLAYRLNAANVLAESEQPDNALRVLKGAGVLAKTEPEKQMLESRMAQMEQYRDALAKASQPPSPQGTEVTTVEASGDGAAGEVAVEKAPEYPKGAPSGPRRMVSGVLRGVKCEYPSVLTLTLDRAGKPVALYANNYFKVLFTTANFEPKDAIKPCNGIEGMKAKIEYGEVTDARVAGQIISIELSK